MHLNRLKLTNFKNLKEIELDFSPSINALVGSNGKGKTNVLDAVHYLSLGKSYLNHKDVQNVQHGSDFFRIEGDFTTNDVLDTISCVVQKEQKKVLQRNGKNYKRLADHVGNFPCVFISPYDSNLISEGSDRRRRFIDAVISQSNKAYLMDLIKYNKLLAQRNALLKYFAKNRILDASQLEIYDVQMLPLLDAIAKERNEFIQDFLMPFKRFYKAISANAEEVNIKYETQSNETRWEELIAEARDKDKLSQYSTVGIHKDDLLFTLDDEPIRKFGSQGQQKTFLIALKLAQLRVMKNRMQKNPILLLDDIFDKLDENRVEQLLDLVRKEQFGQIILSDTHPERTEKLVKKIEPTSKILNW